MRSNEDFSCVAAKYMDVIYRVAYSYLKSPSDADDVTQNVLIRLYQTDKEFETEAHLKHWLIRVTVNQCKNIFRSPWRRNESIEDYANTLHFESPEHSELFTTVMKMDAKYRTTLLLFYYEGYSLREIAKLMSVPEKTVGTRLSRARKKLKSLLTEVLDDDIP